MRKLLLCLLCLLMCFSMLACGLPNAGGTTTVCQHRDVDDDQRCDYCEKAYADGKDVPAAPVCQHRDVDDAQLCDNCEKAYADGKDRVGR